MSWLRRRGAGAADPDPDPAGAAAGGPATQRPAVARLRRILVVSVVVLLAASVVVVSTAFVLTERLVDQVHRYPDVFGGLDRDARPARPSHHALTFLVVGTDSQAAEPTTGAAAGDATAAGGPAGDNAGDNATAPHGGLSDVIMIVQVAGDGSGATVVSVPRDSWVPIPGHGVDKINAAYAVGGPTLLVRTVEDLTDVHIDHFGVIDFAGFEAMTDAVGGIDVEVAEPTSFGRIAFRRGLNHLDGERALAYVRQRHGLPMGDLDRVRRQQNALRALLARAGSNGMMSDPLGTYELLDAITRSVSMDDTMTDGRLRGLAFQLRNLRGGAVQFLTAPVAGLGREGAQSVVHLDRARCAELWTAFNAGTVGDYLRRHPDDSLQPAPR